MIAIASSVLFIGSAKVESQSTGFTIDPNIYELTAHPGDTLSLENNLGNLSPGDTISLSAVNFKQGENDGTPTILSVDESSSFGLASWVDENDEIYVNNDGESNAGVEFSINVPNDALNQTYYGIALFSKRNSNQESFNAKAGALIFIDVGEPKYTASVAGFELSEDKSAGNSISDGIDLDSSSTDNDRYLFVVEVSNDGKYRFTPEIEIDMIDKGNEIVATLKTDEDPGSILPENTRKYELHTDKSIYGSESTYSACLRVKTPSGEVKKSSVVVGDNNDSAPRCEDEEPNLVVLAIIGGGLLIAVLVGSVAAIKIRANKKMKHLTKTTKLVTQLGCKHPQEIRMVQTFFKPHKAQCHNHQKITIAVLNSRIRS